MSEKPTISGYGSVWLFAMFDLPMKTKAEKKEYRIFRKKLLEEGFRRIQFSVYARFFFNEECARSHRRRVINSLPPEGNVRMFVVTEAQYAKMESYYGKKRAEVEKKPEQMRLF
jgi:CRISPR-associated protein Cas2